MSNFSTVLTKLMELKGSVNNEVIRQTGINRSTFFKIKNGTRSPSGYEMVDRITDSLRLTQEHRRLLIEAFEIDKIGAYKYYGLKEVKHFFMNEVTCSEAPLITVSIPEFEDNEHVRIFRNRPEVTAAINGMLHEKCSRIRIMETHMSDLYVTGIPQAARENPEREFSHIFMMDDTEAVGIDHRLYNMRCFRNVMDIMIHTDRYSPRYYYSPVSALGNSGRMINFILSDRYLLTYNDALDSAVLYNDSLLLELYCDIFGKYEEDSACFAGTMDVSEFYEKYVDNAADKNNEDNKVYCFYPGLCSVLALEDDEETMARYLPTAYAGREEFFKYNSLFGNVIRSMVKSSDSRYRILNAANAIESFARTGYINELPKGCCNSLGLVERAALLRQWRLKSTVHNVQVVRDKCIPDTSSISVVATNRKAYVSFLNGQKMKYIRLCVEEVSIAGLIYEYLKSLDQEYVMEKDEYVKFIDGLIAGIGG